MKEKLLEIGLNQTEIELYLAILENNRLTPANLSNITGINRSTVYAAASELLKKGLIEEDLSEKTKYFTISSANGLKTYISRQIKELKEKELLADELIAELNSLPKSKSYSIPKIHSVKGNNIVDFLYKQTPVWEKSMRDIDEKTWWGFQDHSFVENVQYRKWISWYWNQTKGDISLNLFTNQSNIEEVVKKENWTLRHLKFWKGTVFTSTQWILGEYIISIVTQGKQHYLVQIRDRLLADNMRNFAKELWVNK